MASYDRFFPAQDTLPQRSPAKFRLGNLIALPLQGDRRRRQTTVFADPQTWQPFDDQFAVLAAVPPVTESKLPEFASTAALRVGPDETAAPVRRPAPAVLLPGPARDDLDLARDHERGIEADAELADQVQVARAVAAQLGDEALGAGARDRAEVLGQIVPVHADAVVPHGERALRGVGRQDDLQLGIVAQELRLAQAGIAQPVACVRGVGDQLAQEDLAMLVERIDHQVEHAPDLRLERLHLATHGSFPRHAHARVARFATSSWSVARM